MKNWLTKQNKKLLNSIVEKTYGPPTKEGRRSAIYAMYKDDVGLYTKALDKVMERRRKERKKTITRNEKRMLSFQKGLYYVSYSFEKIITIKERRKIRRERLAALLIKLEKYQKSHKIGDDVIADFKNSLIVDYEYALKNLKI